jgi:hypothetical protein
MNEISCDMNDSEDKLEHLGTQESKLTIHSDIIATDRTYLRNIERRV